MYMNAQWILSNIQYLLSQSPQMYFNRQDIFQAHSHSHNLQTAFISNIFQSNSKVVPWLVLFSRTGNVGERERFGCPFQMIWNTMLSVIWKTLERMTSPFMLWIRWVSRFICDYLFFSSVLFEHFLEICVREF